MTCIWSSWCHCHPIISAWVKFRMVFPSGTGLPRLSSKKAVKWVLLLWSHLGLSDMLHCNTFLKFLTTFLLILHSESGKLANSAIFQQQYSSYRDPYIHIIPKIPKFLTTLPFNFVVKLWELCKTFQQQYCSCHNLDMAIEPCVSCRWTCGSLRVRCGSSSKTCGIPAPIISHWTNWCFHSWTSLVYFVCLCELLWTVDMSDNPWCFHSQTSLVYLYVYMNCCICLLELLWTVDMSDKRGDARRLSGWTTTQSVNDNAVLCVVNSWSHLPRFNTTAVRSEPQGKSLPTTSVM